MSVWDTIDEAGRGLWSGVEDGWNALVGEVNPSIDYTPQETATGEYNATADNALAEIRRREAANLPIPQELIDATMVPRGSAEAARLYQDRNNMLNLAGTAGQDYLGLAHGAATGNAPSQAQDTLREGTGRAVSTAHSLAASAPGGGAQRAAAMNQAGWQAAQAGQAGARAGAQLRAQEMSDARAQYGQAIGTQSNIYGQQQSADIDRAKGDQQARVASNQVQANVATADSANNNGLWGKVWEPISDVRLKDDIGTVQAPAFKSALPEQPAQQVQPEEDDTGGIEDSMFWQGVNSAKGGSPAAKGIIASILSDERSKERIRELESALSTTTDALRDTEVEYPTLGLGENESGVSPKRVAPTDLVYDQRSDQFRTPSEQYKYAQSLGLAPMKMKRPEAEKLFVENDEMRTPEEQYRYSEGLLASAKGSRDALGPVGEYEFRYKPEAAKRIGADTEPRLGIMAQELERSPAPELRSAVIDTPQGKKIDGSRAVSAGLALSAGLDKRLRRIEDSLGGDSATLGLRRELGY